jgi:hypothetical protein
MKCLRLTVDGDDLRHVFQIRSPERFDTGNFSEWDRQRDNGTAGSGATLNCTCSLTIFDLIYIIQHGSPL